MDLNTECFMWSRTLLFVLVFFSSLLSTVITSPGEERVVLCVSRAFVCVYYTRKFLFFSLPLGVRNWLRLVTVALLRLFY